ncbi:APC membrane recruitment protein 3 [Ornithorhynchus anatinus]|uniref:APC membrane recruitment protein 3 n=1 Tax=Ornithorhynchus anatinus TaxID=9258 RepID=A0A6I8ND50_ORNAN|nr:APC membrane recruitment protein 3 [Ornithorhynchus anatinus]
MELRRGRTFIKSSLQLSQEKPSAVDSAARGQEGATVAGPSSAGDGQLSGEEGPRASSATQKPYRFSNKAARPGAYENFATSPGSSYKLVRKSKTHDCMIDADKTEGRLVNSLSFSGVGNHLSSPGKREPAVSPGQSSCSSQQMIDYRNFVPQMPFVPAVAKSFPRKRISLKRSKKGFRDIFHMRKNKSEGLAFLVEKDRGPLSPGCQNDLLGGRQGKHPFKTGETFAADCLAQDLSDSELQSDSSYDYCGALCEDVASLKSFDSLTGCGEIFADESSAPLELEPSKESLAQRAKPKENSAVGSFQGGVEQLASPAQNEAADLARFWDNINRSVRLHQSALFDRRLPTQPGGDLGKGRLEAAAAAPMPSQPLSPGRDPSSSKDSSIDTGTPKSEQQESTSTSDEGYYDSFSPGLEDEVKEAQTPSTPGRFPRDSYSGDALYELFYDPGDAKISPILDDDLCVSESISEQAVNAPLSIYSFHVGAEENLAPRPPVDIISQGFLHSTWKGKECLLKLCDTELSLTMGIINWLRKNPSMVSPSEPLRSPPVQLKGSGESMALSSTPTDVASMREAAQQEGLPERSSGWGVGGVQPSPGGQSEQRPWPGVMSEYWNAGPQSSSATAASQGRGGSHLEGLIEDALTDAEERSAGLGLERAPDPADDGAEKWPASQEDKTPGKTSIASGPLLRHCPQKVSRVSVEKKEYESSLGHPPLLEAAPKDSPEPLGGNQAPCADFSMAGDILRQPLTPRPIQSYISPSARDGESEIVQLLERCMSQVASLKISYENKHLEDKFIGKEMRNVICKMSQFKNSVLLQDNCHFIAPGSEHPLLSPANKLREASPEIRHPYCLVSPTRGLVHLNDPKSRTGFIDHMGQVTPSQINFEYAPLNNPALSYIRDIQLELTPADPTSIMHLTRPTFLPLFGSVGSDAPDSLSQISCAMNNSPEKLIQGNEARQYSPSPGGLPECHCDLSSPVPTLPSHTEVKAAGITGAEKNL